MAEKNKPENRYGRLRSNYPVLSSVLIFAFYVSLLLSLSSYLSNITGSVFTTAAASYVNANANPPNNNASMTSISIDKNTHTAIISTLYYDKRNPDGTYRQKNIGVDLYIEYYLPIVLLLSLFLATPLNLKRKLLSIAIGEAVLFFYLAFKFIAVIFDNYSYPEYAVMQLTGLWGGIVYFYNKFLSLTGWSTNYIIPTVIWLIVIIFSLDTEAILKAKKSNGKVFPPQ